MGLVILLSGFLSPQEAHGEPSSTSVPSAPAQSTTRTVSDYVRQGDRAFAEGNYANAVEAYTKALDLFKVNEYALYNRGLAYRKLKDYKNAIADFTATLELNPQNTYAYLYRGMALQGAGQTEMAISDYTALIKINDQEPLAFRRRAEAYVSLNQKDKARENFLQAAELYKKLRDKVQYEKVQSQIRLLK
jgi:tetratricopeptide (TPR) repeat protein